MDLIKAVENLNEDRGFPELYPGDYVKVFVNVVEGNRSRIQRFEGTIIRDRGRGQNRTFTVRRISHGGIGVERTFLYKSPRIDSIEVVRHQRVRRAQLYYLRNLRGKAARLKEVRVINRNKPKYGDGDKQAEARAQAAQAEAEAAAKAAAAAEAEAAAQAEAEAAEAEAAEAEAEAAEADAADAETPAKDADTKE